jgi:hypothetical protein
MNLLERLKRIVSEFKLYDQLSEKQRKAFLKSIQPDAERFLNSHVSGPKETIQNCSSFLPIDGLLLVHGKIRGTTVAAVIDSNLGLRMYSISSDALARFVKTKNRGSLNLDTNF